MTAFPNLEHTIAMSMRQANVPGSAVAIVADNHIVYEQVFGSTRTTQVPLLTAASFQAASLSKPLFAYGVLLLVERGLLDLDTPLSSIVADPAVVDSSARRVTARHVLTHTTGFPNWREDDGETTLRCYAEPGTRFGYSGEGFEYLQRVVEHLTGEPLHAFWEANVLRPLGMLQSRWAWAVNGSGETLLDADGIAATPGDRFVASAAWSLLTTAPDYARFLLAMLAPRPDAPMVLRRSTIASMLTPSVGVGVYVDLAWGLGWGLQQTALGPAFFHWGGPQNGYAAYTATIPGRDTGIVILTNSEGGLRACRMIAESVLGVRQPAFDWLLPEERWTPTAD